ncbi:MAG TPA: patatin-like phospholipase family protein [Candidatus Saccharimonadales bacterium]|nr:patatin-like phospholipase family protein [Candidatus Saccharimonadales bacterium]
MKSTMPSALEVLNSRAKQKKRTGTYKDSYKLALAVEGGGMMGVISAGMLLAINDLELLDLFDVYVGSSSGSINLAYILGEYPEEGLSVYYDHLINHKHVDSFRLVKGEYAIDLKGLERIMKKVIPSPIPNILKNYKDKYFITTTRIKPVEGILISAGEANKDLLNYLIAGATIPYIDGSPRTINKTKYCDGGFAYPDLRMAALELDSTHLFILSTQPGNKKMARYDDFRSRTYKTLLSGRYKNLQKFWIERLEAEKVLLNGSEIFISQINSHQVTVHHNQHKVGNFSKDQWILVDGARKGYEAVVKMFIKEATVGLVPEIL